MNKFNQRIKKAISQEQTTKVASLVGTVLSYDVDTNTANVSSTSSGTPVTFDKVPVMIASSGFIPQALKPGDIVYLVAAQGNLFNVKIIGLSDENNLMSELNFIRRHKQKGNNIGKVVPIDGDYTPRVNKRFSTEDLSPTHIAYMNLQVNDTVGDAKLRKDTVDKEDVAVINPNSNSLLKIKSDGKIHLFTDKDIGLEIDPLTKTISFYGDMEQNTDKWSVISKSIRIKSDDINIETNSLKVNGKEFVNV